MRTINNPVFRNFATSQKTDLAEFLARFKLSPTIAALKQYQPGLPILFLPTLFHQAKLLHNKQGK